MLRNHSRRTLIPGLTIAATLACSGTQAQATTIYHDGVSPIMTGAFEYGTYLPNRIGPTSQDTFAAPITGKREYFYDLDGNLNPATAGSFNLVVYKFSTAKDSVRLFTSQDHYGGGPVSNGLAPELMEYSVWGSNTGGANQSEWTMLSNPTGWSFPTAGKPVYTFEGVEAAEIYRGGSAEGGILNAYTQDYTFSTSYLYFGFRGSSIAMAANTADPELDTMVGFNRSEVPLPGSVPDGGSTIAMLGLALTAVAGARRKFGI